jgi:zinc D-Ala-D-Ala carboxypeptidase
MEIQLINEMLTEHFSLWEMTRSGTAIRKGIDNIPTAEDKERLRKLCQNVLEPLRRRFGMIRVTSGYRSEQLNKAVGGVACSQHLRGEAADINIPNMEMGRRMFDYIVKNCRYDQLLFEHSSLNNVQWLHVSFREGHNRQSASAYCKAA